MTNWVPESRFEPAVGHAARRYRGIGYPESILPLDQSGSPVDVTVDPRGAERGVHGGIVH
jgi:hypothetical protein